MKFLKVALVLSALLPLASFAQPSAFWGIDAATHAQATVPAVRLVRPADVLVGDVTIVATSRNAGEQSVAFNNALQLFRAEVAKSQNVAIEQERTQQGGGSPSSFASAAKLDTARTSAEIKISFALIGGIDSTGAAQVFRALIARLKLPSDVAVRLEGLRVEVRDVEALREPLLRAIAEDASRLQTFFKGSVTVGGLQNAVVQHPLNDREVVVYIPYTLSIGDKR